MIRILHVVHGMDCGGTENIIMNLYRNIDRTKVQFDFLVHTPKKCFFDDEIEQLGGRIFHAPYYNMVNLFSYRRFLNDFFSRHKGEWVAVHGSLGSCACIYLKIAKKYGMYTIAHSHNINSTDKSIKNYLYQLHAYLTRGVPDFYFGCSYEAGKDRYGEKIANSKFFKVLNNGIKSSDYIYNDAVRNNMRKSLRVENKYVVGNVARFSYQKNPLFMVEVLSELRKISDKYILMLVGDGEMRNDIVQKAKDLAVEDALIMTGIRKDVPDVLQAMDLFLFPSFFEGLGIVLIEAQASGLPCIANKDGIMPLAVISDLVEMKSLNEGAKAWAEYIDSLRQNQPERKDMSQVVKSAGFDIVEVAKWLEEFYLKIKK